MALELDLLENLVEAQLDCSLVWATRTSWQPEQPPETLGSPALEAAISPTGLLALRLGLGGGPGRGGGGGSKSIGLELL